MFFYFLQIIFRFCKNNDWSISRRLLPKCTVYDCLIEDLILDYAQDNLIKINYFMKVPYATRFIKDEKVTLLTYIANCGALLILCLGFSLISGVEILYHCFLGIFSSIVRSEEIRRLLDESDDFDQNEENLEEINASPNEKLVLAKVTFENSPEKQEIKLVHLQLPNGAITLNFQNNLNTANSTQEME